MGNQNWTEKQLEAIETKGNVLVSAGAGSGKTTVMLERVMRLVASGVPIERILILVFNNSAGLELRQKITAQAVQKMVDANEEERKFYAECVESLPFSKIGTLDSFCLDLVKQNFEELGVSPSASVVDDSESKMFMEKTMKIVLDNFDKKNDVQFDKLISMFGAKRDEQGVLETIVKLFEIASVQSDENAFLNDLQEAFGDLEKSKFAKLVLKNLKISFAKWKEKLFVMTTKLQNAGQEKRAKSMNFDVEICDDFLRVETLENACKTVANLPAFATIGRDGKNADPVLAEKAKNLNDKFKKFVNSEIVAKFADFKFFEKAHKQNAEYFSKIVEATRLFAKTLRGLMAKEEKFTFNDIEHLAVDVLKGENKDEISKMYDYVFVDEYQDINPVQEFIIKQVLGENNAFMVGDVKQSIYGFRMADPSNFLNRAEKYDQGLGKNVLLNRNWRSNDDILAFVNCIFDVVMTKESCGVDYKKEARFETTKVAPTDNVQIHIFENKMTKKSVEIEDVYNLSMHKPKEQYEIGTFLEAKFVVEEIKRLVGHKKIAGMNRLVEYGDIAILYRAKNGEVAKIVEMFKANNIPFDGENLKQEKLNPENDLIMFLRAIDKPFDDINFAGYLLSFFGGLDENDLATIRMKKQNVSFFEATKEKAKDDDKLAEKLRENLALLEKFSLKSQMKTVSALMESCLFETGYDLKLMSDGMEKFQSVESFVSKIKGKECDENLQKFFARYEFLKTRKSDVVVSKSKDKVLFQTIHKSKGLEYPIVFVVGIANSFSRNSRSGDLLVDAESGTIGMSHFDHQNKIKAETISLIATKLAIQKREAREEMRLFYVAMTRAKEMLYLCGTKNFTKNLDSQLEEEVLGEENSFFDYVKQAVQFGNLFPCDLDLQNFEMYFEHNASENIFPKIEIEPPKFNRGNQNFSKRLDELFAFQYPFETATKVAQKQSVTGLAEEKMENKHGVVMFDKETLEKGTAYHKIMQFVDFEKRTADSILQTIDMLVKNGSLTENAVDLVNIDEIVKCLNSPLIKYASNKICHREKAFQMYVPMSEVSCSEETQTINDKVLIQGVIDLVIEDDETLVLVDYKNSAKQPEKLKQQYRKQLEIYKMALEKGTGKKVKRMFLYSFPTAKTIELL